MFSTTSHVCNYAPSFHNFRLSTLHDTIQYHDSCTYCSFDFIQDTISVFPATYGVDLTHSFPMSGTLLGDKREYASRVSVISGEFISIINKKFKIDSRYRGTQLLVDENNEIC